MKKEIIAPVKLKINLEDLDFELDDIIGLLYDRSELYGADVDNDFLEGYFLNKEFWPTEDLDSLAESISYKVLDFFADIRKRKES